MAPHIDYGSRDFDTVKAALITYLQTQFGLGTVTSGALRILAGTPGQVFSDANIINN